MARLKVVCLLLLLLLLQAGPATAEPALSLAPGAPGVVKTVLQGSKIEEIPLEYLGTLQNYVGPGHDVYLVRLKGEFAEEVGVAAGMSGSPVYFDGKLVGALSYRLGFMPLDAIAGVTPIASMLDITRSGSMLPASASDARPIRTPIITSGMAPAVKDWLSEQFEQSGLVLVAGGGAVGDVEALPFEPGSAVGVALVSGDMTMSATGTVTFVDDQTVYAFGHPFFGAGQVEMPMLSADVIVMLADGLGSVRMTRVGEERGTIVEDRLSGVVGRTDLSASMMPLTLHLEGGAYGQQDFAFEVVRNMAIAPSLIGATVANSLMFNLGYEDAATMMLTGVVRLRGLPDVPVELAYAGEGQSNPSIAIAGGLLQTLLQLWRNPYTELVVEGIDLRIDVTREIAQYRVDSLIYDRGPLRPGQTLDVTCRLRQYRGETVTHDFHIKLPDELRAGIALTLAIGTPQEIEKALGYPIARRLRSAKEIGSVIEALGGLRSPHRLTAVLFERAKGVVTRGAALPALPPTAEHLISRRAASTETVRTYVTPLLRLEHELDGPVSGGLAVKLILEPAL